MAAGSSRKLDWKDFEDFVAQIERLLSRHGAKVRRNEQILDRHGALRQLDATIRINTGTTELLVIIECRNRKRVNDITWVEQVAGKRDNLGAAKAIIVSNRKLPDSAASMAREKSVEIRTLSQVDESILPFPYPMRFVQSQIQWRFDGRECRFKDRPDDPERFQQRLDEVSVATQGEGIRIQAGDGPSSPLQRFVNAFLDREDKPTPAPDQKRLTEVFKLTHGSQPLWLLVGEERFALLAARLHFAAEITDLPPGQRYDGENVTEGADLDHLVTRSEFVKDGESLHFTTVAKRGESSFVMNIPQKFLNEDLQDSIDPEHGVSLEIAFDKQGKPVMRRVH